MSYVLALGVAFASALVPFLSIEAYLLGAMAATDPVVWAIAGTAAVGQAAGKLLLFLGARGVVSHNWLRRRSRSADRPGRWHRWVEGFRRRRRSAVAVVGVSAAVGLPPLLLVSVVAGTTDMRPTTFTVVSFAGRWVRFLVLLAVPGLFIG